MPQHSFCKIDNAYPTKEKRTFVSCLTEPALGFGTKTSDTTWEGKCFYQDENLLKDLAAKTSEPTSQVQNNRVNR